MGMKELMVAHSKEREHSNGSLELGIGWEVNCTNTYTLNIRVLPHVPAWEEAIGSPLARSRPGAMILDLDNPFLTSWRSIFSLRISLYTCMPGVNLL
jgi:hypothetical protein